MNPYRRTISIEGSRGTSAPRVHCSVPAEMMDGSMDEPMGEGDISSTRRRVTFIVKTSDLGGIVPQTGDIVKDERGSRFAVLKVQPFYCREYLMDCRSC